MARASLLAAAAAVRAAHIGVVSWPQQWPCLHTRVGQEMRVCAAVLLSALPLGPRASCSCAVPPSSPPHPPAAPLPLMRTHLRRSYDTTHPDHGLKSSVQQTTRGAPHDFQPARPVTEVACERAALRGAAACARLCASACADVPPATTRSAYPFSLRGRSFSGPRCALPHRCRLRAGDARAAADVMRLTLLRY